MNSTGTQRRSHLVDLTPLRASAAYARMWAGNALAGLGSMVTLTAVGLHIYDLTGSTFMVSLVATFSLGPMIVAGLYGGSIADRYDRRTVALVSSVIAWLSTVGLFLLSLNEVRDVRPYYVCTTVNAVAATIAMTARQAIIPRLLSRELLAKAAAINGISFGLMTTVGPGIAGLLVDRVGYPWTYAVDLVLFTFGLMGIASLPPIRPEHETTPARGVRSVVEGIAQLRHWPNVRMSFLVDIVAMTFGHPMVLMPAVGAVVIGGGTVTAGLLMGAFSVGPIVASLFSGRLTDFRRQGRAVTWAITAYGACIAAFGAVLLVAMTRAGTAMHPPARPLAAVDHPLFWAAAATLAAAGAADQVSSIFRQAILQAAVPDRLRGRMQGIFTVVVTGGPRIGQMYAGTLAALTATWVPEVVGGIVIIIAVTALARATPHFAQYDAANPTP